MVPNDSQNEVWSETVGSLWSVLHRLDYFLFLSEIQSKSFSKCAKMNKLTKTRLLVFMFSIWEFLYEMLDKTQQFMFSCIHLVKQVSQFAWLKDYLNSICKQKMRLKHKEPKGIRGQSDKKNIYMRKEHCLNEPYRGQQADLVYIIM